MEKSFILGIGSQRAGSTFLARLLNQHPEIAIHPLKELHYFDTKFGLRDEEVLKNFSKVQLDREINELCNAQKFDFITYEWQWYVKTNYQLFTKPISAIQYFDLFSDVVNQNYLKFIGESTPEYMLLNSTQINKMKEIIGNAYIILMCRNPVQRIVSAFRLLIEYGQHNDLYNQDKCDELFLNLINNNNNIWTKRQIIYNNYQEALQKYSSHFDNILLLPYDDLTKDPQKIIKSIAQFTNLEFQEQSLLSLFEKKINSLSLKYTPNPKIISKLTTLFEKQQQDLINLFGYPLIY
ncbi:hypothetical protein NIES4102_29970 [Chondrocystis sp. NIES-4102]|nr:hypothetical protein NIES4102_29970 [Chondrocystis sp. NIES-4102]